MALRQVNPGGLYSYQRTWTCRLCLIDGGGESVHRYSSDPQGPDPSGQGDYDLPRLNRGFLSGRANPWIHSATRAFCHAQLKAHIARQRFYSGCARSFFAPALTQLPFRQPVRTGRGACHSHRACHLRPARGHGYRWPHELWNKRRRSVSPSRCLYRQDFSREVKSLTRLGG
jgi:hypothetical protein